MDKPTVFISYSHKDEVWKDRLKSHLVVLENVGRISVWDDRKIDPGGEWYPKIREAMENAAAAVCLISADYLASDFCVKEEIPYLLERREQHGMVILPILIRKCAWPAFSWIEKTQMLPRDGKSVSTDYKDRWDDVFADVAIFILDMIENPDYEPPPRSIRWSPPEKVAIDRLPMTGAELLGRKKELELLDSVWKSEDTHVVSLAAWGGMGKSTLVNKWLEKMGEDNYRGARRVYAWSFYSQGTGVRITSADQFIREALEWFGDSDPDAGSIWNKGKRLAGLVQKEKTLLILDGLEPLQSPHEFDRGKLKDPALEMLISGLAKNNPGLCIITTREKLVGMDRFGVSVHQMDLERISVDAGRALLRIKGAWGTDEELENATREFGAHALALNLLARYLRGIKGHHISNAHDIPDLDIDEEKGKHPRRIMEAFEIRFGKGPETDVLRVLGLFDRPAEKGAIDAIKRGDAIPGLTEQIHDLQEADWLRLLDKLRETALLARKSDHQPDALDCHPLVREHFGQKLKENYPEAWKEAHGRLYDYYRNLPEKVLPDTLEEMEPLFAAVAHGCQAERHQEVLDSVYYPRIQRDGDINYCCNMLGAIGSDLAALSGFFEIAWTLPTSRLTDSDKSAVLNWAGFRLISLGRLREASQPMQAALEICINRKDLFAATIDACNLSELYLSLGDVKHALDYARRSVKLADQSGKWGVQVISRTTLADAFHQEGKNLDAERLFVEAETIQNERRSGYPFLHSLWGFRYCDLLLYMGKYREVRKRASLALEWGADKNRFLDIALNKISLGRAHLLHSLEEKNNDFTMAEDWLNQAMVGLREAGTQHHITRGLYARASLHRTQEEFHKAWVDLEEAREIAEQGSMGLYLADYHLEAARLHLAQGQQAEARENLEIAGKMIEEMGYHRRDREIEELKADLNGQDEKREIPKTKSQNERAVI